MKKTKKTAIACSAVLYAAFSTAAARGEQPAHFPLVPPPSCTNAQGQAVNFYYRDAAFFERFDLRFGMAFNDAKNGRPIAVLDKTTLATASSEFQHFAGYHECAHHENGDPKTVAGMSFLQKLQAEDAADCRAIKRLRDEKSYSSRELEIIIRDMTRLTMQEESTEKSANLRAGKIRVCHAMP